MLSVFFEPSLVGLLLGPPSRPKHLRSTGIIRRDRGPRHWSLLKDIETRYKKDHIGLKCCRQCDAYVRAGDTRIHVFYFKGTMMHDACSNLSWCRISKIDPNLGWPDLLSGGGWSRFMVSDPSLNLLQCVLETSWIPRGVNPYRLASHWLSSEFVQKSFIQVELI